MKKQTVCLSMIVKNESKVIERCLNSIKKLIDCWIVIDTGSTDATQAIIKNTLKKLPGYIINEPWVDFSHNRNTALKHAANMADYLFIIDADEIMKYDKNFTWPVLKQDMYFIECEYGDIKYPRAQLINSSIPWRYEGVVHEALMSSSPHSYGYISNIQCIPSSEGNRSIDPLKYQKDAIKLLEAHIKQPSNTRTVFYLAQSFRDCEDYHNAIKYYEKRCTMDGYTDEIWYSYYQIALLKDKLQYDWTEISNAMLKAYEYNPKRAESLYYLCRWHRIKGNMHSSILYGKEALSIPFPKNQLFVEWNIYKYKILDEYSISLYYIKQFKESARICQDLLRMNLPENDRKRIEQNLQFALQGEKNAI